MTTAESDQRAHDSGIERGWNAANYADAYGGDPMEGINDHSYSGPDFEAGYREGIERFGRQEWSDGTPVQWCLTCGYEPPSEAFEQFRRGQFSDREAFVAHLTALHLSFDSAHEPNWNWRGER